MPATARKLGFKWFPCLAHVINLCVEDALKPLKSTLKKARKISTFFHKSQKKADELKIEQRRLGMNSSVVVRDVKTRWNSTYDMLKSITVNQDPITSLIPVLSPDAATPT